jgi:hypothetical protein
MQHNLDILDRISCQKGWFDVAFLIMLMMWIGLQMVKLLLIVPANKWDMGKNLVGIVNVSLALTLKKNWSGENTFVSTTVARSHIGCD